MRIGSETRRAGKGFTLVELLVVIAILALLVGILIPAVGHAKKIAQDRATQTRIMSIAAALEQYAQANSGLYPGQADYLKFFGPDDDRDGVPDVDPTDFDDKRDYCLAGSQVLGAALTKFNVQFDNGTDLVLTTFLRSETVTNPYIELKEDFFSYLERSKTMGVVTVESDPGDASYHMPCLTVLDTFSDPMPILYFPARGGRSYLYRNSDNLDESVFNVLDNAAYYSFAKQPGDAPESRVAEDLNPTDEDALAERFYELFTDTRLEEPLDEGENDERARAYMSDSYILLGAGMDRLYFTDDDTVNFTKQ